MTPTISPNSFTTAFAAAPDPPPPNISTFGGPHICLSVGQSPTISATFLAFSSSSASRPKNLSIPSVTDLPIPKTLNFEEISIVLLKSILLFCVGPIFTAQSNGCGSHSAPSHDRNCFPI